MVVAAGAPPPDGSEETEEFGAWQPAAVFSGNADGRFDDRTAEVGFHDSDPHYGLAVADLQGDG
jgi:hypothetical protein